MGSVPRREVVCSINKTLFALVRRSVPRREVVRMSSEGRLRTSN